MKILKLLKLEINILLFNVIITLEIVDVLFSVYLIICETFMQGR
jgi:hypothetical protein